ncbi:uncharacterized protein DNG_01623 [Cephalotrichum gorgonifer]|uniref:Folliculin-interacting protein N-terminal domain-containing protein n=1 Tax=Cephalotrichum gorgonifer TaxID=2041049 RepID=A0AAE8MTC9_9PEZI|nr:uncharacterized protein DNG_01623 [Cephalotrichum gorgonifer]
MAPPPASVSMLGKLFSIGAGTPGDDQQPHPGQSSRPGPALDSVQEDIHTRSLLFPDPHSLYLHRNDQVFPLSTTPTLPLASMSNAFDHNGELELEARDVRVLIMQDALGPFSSSLLFDTHPCPVSPAASSPIHDTRRPPPSPRKPSIGQSSRPVLIQPDNPHLRHGAFDRRPEGQSRHSFAETDPQRAAREYREELTTFTSCIFGSSELMAYKGTSTKVHVVPTEARVAEYSASVITDGRGSVGRTSMRSSKLAQSYSSEIASPTYAPSSFATTSHFSYRPVDRKKVLITRLFPVALPFDDTTADQNSQGQSSCERPVKPGQRRDNSTSPKKTNVQIKQKRTPMYAVVLVIQLPPPPVPTARTPFRGSGSFTDQDSFPSSFNSAKRSGWAGHDSVDSSPFEGDEPMDYITQHWDIIMRTLTHLQSVAATNLVSLLRQADQGISNNYPPNSSQSIHRVPSLSRRADDYQKATKPPKSNAKIIALPPNALSQDPIIQQQTQEARSRIVAGLKAARVVTGQGRWGIWRDEARLAARSVGMLDNRFLLGLLTGFLATHTDWLQALSPAWCRKRYFQQQRSRGEVDLAVSTRTIIVSEDKMLARRFVFLLSAFLPAHQSIPAIHPHRPSTSTSVGPLSQSPPSIIVPIVREESLRRKMTRRTGPRRASHSRTISQSTRASIPTQLAHLSMEGQGHHERRGSDAASIRTMNLSIPYGEAVNRKGAAATTTTTPDASTPHFSNTYRSDNRRSARPGSSSSVAADDLRRSLQRAESTGQSSIMSTDTRSQSSRWGSVISGLWSGSRRRDSTTSVGDVFRPPPSPAEPPSASMRAAGKPNKLDEMVRELSMPKARNKDRAPGDDDPVTPRGLRQGPGEEAVDSSSGQIRRWPEPGAPFETQIKTTVNREDGVIDVDVPFTDYLTNSHSFDTAVSSPSSSGYLSTPGVGTVMDSFEQACRLALEGDLPFNSAGWLQSFHPDFVLQAVPPQRDLVREVKAAMRAEPSPQFAPSTPTEQPSKNEWIDVSTAIIADTTTGKVRRIRYRRLVRTKPTERTASPQHGTPGVHSGAQSTPPVLPLERLLDEEFIEDEIMAVDPMVAEAVERVIAQAGDSKAASSNSSRSNSKPRTAETADPSPASGEGDDAPRMATLQEVPRNECRTVILTALADVIGDVIEKRNMEEDESAIRVAVRSWIDGLGGVEAGI